MSLKKLIGKILPYFLTLSLISCADFVPYEKPSLKLSAESLALENAVAGSTSIELIANVTGISSDLVWSIEDEDVADLIINKTTAKILVKSNGSTKITCSTKDNSYSAICNLTVVLGKVYCHSVNSISAVDIEADSLSVNWNCDDDVPQIKIIVTKKDDSTIVSEKIVNSSDLSCKFEDLMQQTEYSISAVACCNPGTSTEYFDESLASVDVTTLSCSTAPKSVSNVKAIASDHGIKFTWNEPTGNAFTQVIISSENTNLSDEDIISVSVNKGTTEWTFENLKSNCDYKFVLSSKDKFGNVQGDLNNTDNKGFEISVHTLVDTTVPPALENVSINVKSSSISIVWDDDAVSLVNDFAGIELWCNNELHSTLSAGTKFINLELESGDYNFALYTFDYDDNKSEAVLFSFQTGGFASSTVSSYSVESQWTGQLKVNWETDDLLSKYVLCAINQADPNDINYSKVYDAVDEKGVINDLRIGATYDVYVCSVAEGYTYDMFVMDDSISHSAQVKKLVYEIAQPWGSRRLVPFITETENFVNCVIAQNDESHYGTHRYQKWVVMPAINGDSDCFSLLACTKDGVESDLYFNVDSSISGSMDTDVDNTGWGHSIDGDGIYSRVGTLDKIKNKGLGTFYFGDLSVDSAQLSDFSEWKTLFCLGNEYQIWSTNSNVIAEPKSYVSGKGKSDTAFAYKETIITE